MSAELYTNEDIQLMKVTKESISKSRLEELIKFAKASGYKKLGIANCLSMQKYTDNLVDILEKDGFKVFARNCKNSGLTYADLFDDDTKGLVCDPASQAKYLNDKSTDLNINLGLCLGHGLIFEKYSKVFVTTLIVKDFSTKHHTVENLEG